MPDQLMIVQFPHPGPEHNPTGSWMPWNRGDHARKFLCSHGRFITNGRVESADLCFWGEWEAQSTVERRFDTPQLGHPRLLHRPYLQALDDDSFRQNTDPLVFGDRFLYSNCRQPRNQKLRELAPGSLILFGSKLHGGFALDTVFVVHDSGTPYSRATSAGLVCPAWVQSAVLEPLRLERDAMEAPLRLYRGRAARDDSAGPFCFVPCRPLGEEGSPFARPPVELDQRWLSVKLTQNAKATPATPAEIRGVWASVAEQVAAAGLLLGVWFEPPPVIPGPAREAQATRVKC